MSLTSLQDINTSVSAVCHRFVSPPIWNEQQLDRYVHKLVDEVFSLPSQRMDHKPGSLKLVGASSENFVEIETSRIKRLPSTGSRRVRDVGTNISLLAPVTEQPSASTTPKHNNISEKINPRLKALYSQISFKVYSQYLFPSRHLRKRKEAANVKKLRTEDSSRHKGCLVKEADLDRGFSVDALQSRKSSRTVTRSSKCGKSTKSKSRTEAERSSVAKDCREGRNSPEAKNMKEIKSFRDGASKSSIQAKDHIDPNRFMGAQDLVTTGSTLDSRRYLEARSSIEAENSGEADSSLQVKVKSSKGSLRSKRSTNKVMETTKDEGSSQSNLKQQAPVDNLLSGLSVQQLPGVSIRGDCSVQRVFSIDIPPSSPPVSRNVFYREVKYRKYDSASRSSGFNRGMFFCF